MKRFPSEKERDQSGKTFAGMRRSRPLVLILFLALAFGYGFSSCGESAEQTSGNANEMANGGEVNSLPANLSNAIAETENDDKGAYANFSHDREYHMRLPCLACHTRPTNAAKISFPGRVDHSPCAGCHTIQFRNKKSSICTICHIDPETGSMKKFPGLDGFGARFDHSKHRRANCGTCHRPAGVTRSIPKGQTAHTTCFSCHSNDASNSMASCGTCHQKGEGRFIGPGGAKAFKANFSHAEHSGKKGLNCSSCHVILARAGGTKQVTAPATAMHFAIKGRTSCGSCHNGKRAFGADDFANCKRCHTGNSFRF